MKLLIGLALASLVLGSSVAFAQESSTSTPSSEPESQGEQHKSIGLGFHNIDAPLGVRWWFGQQKVGLDLGFGYVSDDVGDESFSNFTFDAGVPIVLKSWDRVHFLVRPGVAYHSQQVDIEPGPGVTKDNNTQLNVSAELEAEVFLVHNFSVSAAEGIALVNDNPAVGTSTTDFETTGENFAHIGFHVYLWGGR
jgi:hypothetical protein